jgi:hypothetical protein
VARLRLWLRRGSLRFLLRSKAKAGRGDPPEADDFLLPKQAELGSEIIITYLKYYTFESHLFLIYSDHAVHGVHDIN